MDQRLKIISKDTVKFRVFLQNKTKRLENTVGKKLIIRWHFVKKKFQISPNLFANNAFWRRLEQKFTFFEKCSEIQVSHHTFSGGNSVWNRNKTGTDKVPKRKLKSNTHLSPINSTEVVLLRKDKKKITLRYRYYKLWFNFVYLLLFFW